MKVRNLTHTALTAVMLLGLAMTASFSNASDDDRDDHKEHEYKHDHEYAHDLSKDGEILKLETILSNADIPDSYRVLEVEFEREHGEAIYEVEMIDPDGKVHEYEFDARTGEQREHH
jgi:uncharacterized membrane protein YkoI